MANRFINLLIIRNMHRHAGPDPAPRKDPDPVPSQAGFASRSEAQIHPQAAISMNEKLFEFKTLPSALTRVSGEAEGLSKAERLVGPQPEKAHSVP